jgi:2'-5' RNA ligase
MNQDQLRIFVGIKIIPEVADQLARLALPLEPFSVRFIRPADLHVTLVPPWNEPNIEEVISKLDNAIRGCRGFCLKFDRLRYGPTRKQPRLLLIECQATPEIEALRALLFQALGHTEEGEPPFLPHVTIARIPDNGRMIARRHPMNQDLAISQRVEAVTLFRSTGGAAGEAGYEVLASFSFEQ